LLHGYDKNMGYFQLIDYITDTRALLFDLLKLSILKEVKWLDDLTERITATFFTYNVEYDMLAMTEVVFLKTLAGEVTPSVTVTVVPVNGLINDDFTIALGWILMCFVASSMFSELFELIGYDVHIFQCRMEKKDPELHIMDSVLEYVADFWNVVDLSRVVCFFSMMAQMLVLDNSISTLPACLNVMHTVTIQTACLSESYADVADKFASFQLNNAFLVLIHMIWILKYMRHKRLAVVRDTIYTSGDELGHFLIVFFIIYFGFVFMATLFFGEALEEYSTFGQSFNSCFQILLGAFDYTELETAYPLGAVLFFWSFILVCSFILFNITIGIVCAAFDVAKGDGENQGSVFADAAFGVKTVVTWASHKIGNQVEKVKYKASDTTVAASEYIRSVENSDIASEAIPDEDYGNVALPVTPVKEEGPTQVRTMEDSETNLTVGNKLDSMIETMFERYDFDNSGTLNNPEEFSQLTLNLLFKLETGGSGSEIRINPDDIKTICHNVVPVPSDEDAWEVGQYTAWFQATFGPELHTTGWA